jgi:PLP dependent protein
MITSELVTARMQRLRERCTVAGSVDVTIIGVTKGHGAEAIRAAAGAGLTAVGESYAQELVTKDAELGLVDGDRWPAVHFIGGLQRNKVRRIADIVDVWQSVDRPRLADEIARRAPGAEIMIQVDISNEESKGGCPPDDVADLVKRATDAGLLVTGLMAIGPLGAPDKARPGFRMLRTMVDDLGLSECSMGMSADLEIAVEEGSTMIRVGTDLFGPRPPRA